MSLASSRLEVDEDAGTIRNVSVITAGIARPANARPFTVDRTTLTQVAAAINSHPNGLRSRMTHPELEGKDALPQLLGKISNARVEGDKVVADFTFGAYADPEHRRRLLALAGQAPEDAGLSIVVNEGHFESVSGGTTPIGRIKSLFAIDWVGEPAANPAGMLSKTSLNLETGMYNEKQMAFLIGLGLDPAASEQEIAQFVADLDEDQISALTGFGDAPVDDEPVDDGEGVDDSEPVLTGEGSDVAAPVAAKAASGDRTYLTQDQATKIANEAVVADRRRHADISEIAQQAGLDSKWAHKQFMSGATVETVRQSAFKHLSQKMAALPQPGSGVRVGQDNNRDTLTQAVMDAIWLKAGSRTVGVKFSDEGLDGRVCMTTKLDPFGRQVNEVQTRQPHERAADFRYLSILEMGRRYLSALGYEKAETMARAPLARLLMSRIRLQQVLKDVYLSHSTGDFPNLLADVMGKSLRAAYALQSPTWRGWAASTTAPDFKTIRRLQLSEAADLAAIAEGAEYTYGTLTETQETYTLGKFGKGLKFTRESMINDDLSAFDRIPRQLGNAAVRLEEVTAYNILINNAALSDAIALFHASHNNLTTGVLNVANLGAARAAMRKQTPPGSNDPLELSPAVLLVPEDLSHTAEQLIASAVDPALSNATPNPFANRMQVISSARLSTDSAVQWYLIASNGEIDTVEVAFLEGEEAPTIEEEDEFNDDTRRIKVRHHVAAKAIDFRGMVRSSGA